MKKITKQDIVDSVYDKWIKQYKDTTETHFIEITKLLKDAKTEKEVDDVIGNDSWTVLVCTSCEKDQDEVVEIKKAEQWVLPRIVLCKSCLTKALNIV